MGRRYLLLTIAADFSPTQIIGQDEDDIRYMSTLGGYCATVVVDWHRERRGGKNQSGDVVSLRQSRLAQNRHFAGCIDHEAPPVQRDTQEGT
jgi:hypothetical protein